MRSGDPKTARASATWTSQHKPFASPVQRSVGPNQASPASNPPASSMGIGEAVQRNQELRGGLNTGNGGIYPKAKMNF